ncbi:glycosyltransferase family 2 protein [Photobacterium sanguinicancri]|uniref:Glycosyltransferase family 2 protein n=1 Tax=Photobacterium sanguinicancri TaxID=875932 RepID=A0AAW7Y585_9GAMM|nr:glycosyltransferase family 2 protein [Photobacterium sanguinicancri]MDO6542488.1 glycosyltransferase family 2 protein [Photobacterium sanguinicancri]
MIKLSVIIPTCNRQHSLRRSVNSVLDQNIDNLEVIVVDDYKEDQTSDITNLFADISCVRVVKSWSHSPSGARNIGVSNAKGEYITFLDDDDIYLPGRLKNMLSYFETSATTLSFVSSGRFFETDDFKTIFGDDSQIYGEITLSDVLEDNGIDIGFLMRRDFFNKLNGFDETFSSLEDWDIILRSLLVNNGYKLQRLDYVVNAEIDRNRVSFSQEKSRNKLADKYLFTFGSKWYYENKLRGLHELGLFDWRIFLKSLRYSHSLLPIKIVIKHLLKAKKNDAN